jgi:hypothetical protein
MIGQILKPVELDIYVLGLALTLHNDNAATSRKHGSGVRHATQHPVLHFGGRRPHIVPESGP